MQIIDIEVDILDKLIKFIKALIVIVAAVNATLADVTNKFAAFVVKLTEPVKADKANLPYFIL